MRVIVLALIALIPATIFAANTPCSGKKGGIDHCEGSRFICKDGSASQSARDCSTYTANVQPSTIASKAIQRDDDGRIHRSNKAKNMFKHQQPCPSTGKPTGACSGWVIDHIKALACGGLDDPSNMQWQTTEQAKEKDKWERKDCDAN
jgi:hypothetical protein